MSDTFSNNKRIAKNTLMLYFRMLFLMLVGLYTSRVILYSLGVEDFGIYNVVGGVVVMLSFLKGSLITTSSRYITMALGHGDIAQTRKIFSICVLLHIIFSVFILIIAEFIGPWFIMSQMQIPIERMTATLWVFHSTLITAIITIVYSPYNAVIIAHERMNVFTYISILECLLKLMTAMAISLSCFDRLIFYAILTVICQLIITICYWIYCRNQFVEAKFIFCLDKKIIKEMMEFIGLKMTDFFAAVGYTQGLNILLNIFFNPVVNAARGVAFQIEGVIKSFCMNFQTAFNPQLIMSYSRNDFKKMHELLVTESKFSFFLLFGLSLPVMFEIEILLKWWLEIIPEHTITFVRIILVTCMMSALSNPLITAANATGHIRKFQLVESSILLSVVPISYLLLKYYDLPPKGVFIVNLIITIVAHLPRIYIVLSLIGMKKSMYVNKVIIPILVLIIISPILPYLCYISLETNTIRTFFITTTFCLCSTTATIYSIGCTANERQMINNMICKIINKIKRE